jgi:PilZ domain-containing protein
MRPRGSAKLPLRVSKDVPAEASVTPASAAAKQAFSKVDRVSALPFNSLRAETPRRFARVPTHAIGVYPDHREYPRAALKLPLRLRSINSVLEQFPVTLVTRDISSTGVYFLCPKQLSPGASVELDIVLVSRPLGHGNVVLTTRAHILRFEQAAMPGWFGIAASFDDVEFDRDDDIPSRFLKP